MNAEARRRVEETENEKLFAAAREVDRIAHHEVHHLEAMAGVIKRYVADAVAQAVQQERNEGQVRLANAVEKVRGEWRTQVTALRQVHTEEITRLRAALLRIVDTQPNSDPTVWHIVMAAQEALDGR